MNAFFNRTLRRRAVTASAALLSLSVLGLPSASGAVSADPCPSSLPSVCLPNSTFESGDGDKDLSYTATGSNTERDWSAPGTGIHYLDTQDLPPGSGDNSFGQGAKEDIPNPNIVAGSIPKNKSDLSHFYTAYETRTVGSAYKTFLYLGWQRLNTLGNANMDFEFNQNPTQTYANPAGTGTAVRTAGDILVTFDFPGSGSPVLSMFKWTTSGSTSQCYSSNALPCWGQGSLGNLSSASVTEANAGVSSDGLFGEAGINLSDAGAFATTGCTTFGDGLLKSRSSSAFTSEIKDYIMLAKNSIAVSNCGQLKIHKQDDAGTAMSGVVFTLYNKNLDGTKGSATGFTCTTNASGDCTFTNGTTTGLAYGDYIVSETTYPSGYTPAADFTATVSTTSGDNPITKVNNRNPASVTFVKKDDAGVPLQGAVFTLYNDLAPTASADGFATTGSNTRGAEDTAVSPAKTCTTTATGTCAITGIVSGGTYWIHETTTPAGYTTVADYRITLTLGQDANITPVFTDPRKFKIITLVCVDNSGHNGAVAATPDLYGSKVGFDGPAPSTANSLTGVPAALAAKGVTAADLCALTGAYVDPVANGAHTSAITIP